MAPLSPERRALLRRLLRERGMAPARSEIRRVPGRGPWPLSLNQEGLWVLEQIEPGQANHSVPAAVRLRGRLDAEALERSLVEIVRRQAALRTRFQPTGAGTPVQVVDPAPPRVLSRVDLSGLPPAERETEAVRLATAEARRPFDLARGPVFRAGLLRLDDDEHVLTMNAHHIVCDGWSMGVLGRELDLLYRAFAAGRPGAPGPPAVRFVDVARWERRWIESPEGLARRRYWARHLAGAPPTLALPTDRPRPPLRSFAGRHHSLAVDPALAARLRALARAEAWTPFAVLSAAFRALLCARTGQVDVVVGTTVAGRERLETHGLIGCFATLLPVRTDFSGDPSFRDMVRRTHAATLDGCAHALPFPLLVRDLAPPRDPGRNPIFHVAFTVLTPDRNPSVYGYGLAALPGEAKLADLVVAPLEVEGGVARLDLEGVLWDLGDAIAGTVEYSTTLFDAATITALSQDFGALLTRAVGEPDLPLSALIRRPAGPMPRGGSRGAAGRRLRAIRRPAPGPVAGGQGAGS